MRGRRAVGRRVAIGAIVALAGCRTDTFACEDNTQCEGAMAGGQCEMNGYCSFPDDACPSGRRYGELAGGGLAGFCVVGQGATTGEATTGSVDSIGSGSGAADSESGAGETPAANTETSANDSTGTVDGDTTDASTGSSTGPEVDDDLLLWLEFDDIDSAQGVAVDSSGNGRDAFCTRGSCPTVIEGPVGNAALFDGVGSVLQVSHDATFDLVDGLTLAAWIRLDGLPVGTYAGVVGKSYGNQSLNSYELYYTVSGGDLLFNMDAMTSRTTSYPLGMEPSPWIHVAGTWDGSLMRMYIDGQLHDSAVTEMPPAHEAVPLLVGADLDGGVADHFWHGAIDELRVYTRELDADEVAALAAR